MNPGLLNRRIQFVNATQAKGADENYTVSYSPITQIHDGKTWAEVKPYSGRRQLEAGEPVITEGTQFVIRYRPDFTPQKAMRILYLDRYYVIHGLRDINNEHRFWEILTKVTDDNSGAES